MAALSCDDNVVVVVVAAAAIVVLVRPTGGANPSQIAATTSKKSVLIRCVDIVIVISRFVMLCRVVESIMVLLM